MQIVKKHLIRDTTVLAFVTAMIMVPWEAIFHSVRGYDFVDRSNYIDYFLFQEHVFEYRTLDTVLDFISFEILWHRSVAWLVHDVGVPIEYVFAAISFLLLFVFARIIVTRAGLPALLLLVNPLVVDFAFSQLRLALAIAILGIAYLLKDRFRRLPLALVALTPFLHTGALIFILIYLVPRLAARFASRYRQDWILEFAMLLVLGALISLAIGPLREAILGFFGDRRADYHDMSSSFVYSAFWVALLVPAAIWARRLIVYDYFRYTVVVLSIVAVNLVHGGYSTRFLAAAFPFIVCSMMALPRSAMVLVFFAFIAYATFQWAYWLRILGG